MSEQQQSKGASSLPMDQIGNWQKQMLFAEKSLHRIFAELDSQAAESKNFDAAKKQLCQRQFRQELASAEARQSRYMQAFLALQHEQMLSDMERLREMVSEPLAGER